MGLFVASHGAPSLNLSHISYNDKTCQSYPLPKEDPKIYKSRDTSLDNSIFSRESSNVCYIKKYRYRLQFNTKFLILLTFCESLKIFLINMVTILMMSTKLATPGLLNIRIFQNKDYDVILLYCDATNKILSRDSNDIVLYCKLYGQSLLTSISIREVIITSIL